jgi:DNA-binding transcriptional LysR family regulator
MNQTMTVGPQVLSWKSINNSDNPVYLSGALQKRQGVQLKGVLAEMQKKWTVELEKTFAETKTHFEIAGGNYSFFFVLPAVFKSFQKAHPLLRLKLDLLELRDGKDLRLKDVDMILSSRSVGPDPVDYSLGAKDEGYVVSRKNYKDTAYFAATGGAIKKHGSKENVLKHHDFINDRTYVTINFDIEKTNRPSRYKKLGARFSVGVYAVAYEMMLQDIGISYIHKGNSNRNNVVIVDHNPVDKLERFVIAKKETNSFHRKILKNYLLQKINTGL